MTREEEVRKIMIQNRFQKGLSIKKISQKTGISQTLLAMVEGGEVTHPKIAKKMQRIYGLTDLETEMLMPKNYREHGGDYEPDRYKMPDPPFNRSLETVPWDLADVYIAEHNEELSRNYKRRGM